MLKCNGLRFVQTHERNGDEIYKHCNVRYELTTKPVPRKRETRYMDVARIFQSGGGGGSH